MEKLACQKETITSFSHDVLHFIKSLLSRRMFCLSTFFSQLVCRRKLGSYITSPIVSFALTRKGVAHFNCGFVVKLLNGKAAAEKVLKL